MDRLVEVELARIIINETSDQQYIFLREKGGSGYLPLRLIEQHIDAGRFHRVNGAPEFERSIFLVMNDDAVANWPFLDELLKLARVA